VWGDGDNGGERGKDRAGVKWDKVKKAEELGVTHRPMTKDRQTVADSWYRRGEYPPGTLVSSR